MKHYSISTLLAVTLLVAAFPMTGAAQSTDVLFQEAQRLERVQGDYQGAIGIYQQIVGGASTERTLVARALVQMGKAYESLGRTEAFSVYERVVRDFADVDEQVSEARSRMRGLAVTEVAARPEPMSRTEVDLGDISYWGAALSPTGRFVVGARTDASGLGILELATSEQTFVPPGVDPPNVWGNVRFSPDESKLAYTHSDGQGSTVVRVVEIETGRSSTLVDVAAYYSGRESREMKCGYSQVQDWSRDGSMLLVYLAWSEECPLRGAASEELLMVPLDGSAPTPLSSREGDNFDGESSCLSADGRYAFTSLKEDEASVIRRYDTQTQEAVRWRAGDDGMSLMGCTWEPDRVLYRTEVLSGFVVRSGAPDELDPETDEAVFQLGPKAWSLVGSKYGDIPVWTGVLAEELVVAQIDAESGRLEARDRVTDSYVTSMDWSPSGHLLAWTGWEAALTIWDSRDGGRKIVPLEKRPRGIRWVAEDRLSMLVPNRNAGPDDWRDTDRITLAAKDGMELRRLEAGIADSLGINGWVAKPLGKDRWMAFAWKRECLIELKPETWEHSDLKCFESGSFRGMSLTPSPWGGRTATLGYRPDTTWALGLIDNDGSSYRELRVDSFSKWPGGDDVPVRWLSEDKLMYGVFGDSGWELTVVIDLTTGESTEVLPDLLAEFAPRFLSISPGGKHVAAVGTGKRLDGGGDVYTIIHNVFGDR